MNAVLALAPRLRRAGGRDARVTTSLAITAFAVTTGLTLSVVGGLMGFTERAEVPVPEGQGDDAGVYVILAWIAVVLLVVPLITLAGAAARLGVARRDARLATLRLLGATPREVVGLTVAETAWQGLVGAVLGILLYAALLPLCALLPFQGTTFTVGELWVGWQGLAIAVVGVPLLAAVSGAVSLRRVTVSPLGVARRETPKGMTWLRLVVAVVGIGIFMVISAAAGSLGAASAAALIGAMAVGFATLNAVGPWVLGLVGKVQLRRARTPARLLAARRLLDDPKAAWRVVGGLGLAGFVAGALAVLPSIVAVDMSDDPKGAMLMDDLVTGAMVTLVVAFLLAAVSAGIAQAASVLDRRREIALQNLAGTPVELHDAVRRRTVLVPLLFVAVGSALTALVMFYPLLGLAAVSSPQGPLMLAAFLTGGCALVFAATETSRPLLRSVLAETVVRAD
ncbi:FtsX-like permease family protein [Cellulomonas xylanilytica]|uniref:Permease n=1 Tax=Cellulomonas xylanilytica TaxID=233583 RepID=A0A510V3H4_9CELL|nr:FtsX-like permease family protein [Cellulomonas xylanilytica]GEK20441.1 permease [Cellulomonas xylanilytica]